MRYLLKFGWKLGFLFLAAAAIACWLKADNLIVVALAAMFVLKFLSIVLPWTAED